MFQEVGGVRGVGGRIKPRRAVLSLGHGSGEPPCLGWRGGGAVGGVGFRWVGVGSSSVVLYLPGCVRVCGGVRWGDAPRCGGVLLGLLGLSCCLKKGLSTRPSIIHTHAHTTTRAHARTTTTRTDTTDGDRTKKEGKDERGRIVGNRVHSREEVKKNEKKKRSRT